jgi:hypothetical protein
MILKIKLKISLECLWLFFLWFPYVKNQLFGSPILVLFSFDPPLHFEVNFADEWHDKT